MTLEGNDLNIHDAMALCLEENNSDVHVAVNITGLGHGYRVNHKALVFKPWFSMGFWTVNVAHASSCVSFPTEPRNSKSSG
jgi:hypothetical protein